jgi:4-amino-4-deoxy-L-arabinose transferase-like glycosyltransferase
MTWFDRPDRQRRAFHAGVFVLALTSALYLIGLDRVPAFGGDEAHFAIHAESIGRSGGDLNGRAFPVFVRISDPLVRNHSTTIWYQPALFYLMAPVIKLFGVHVWSARLPVAAIAIANVWLMYLAGRRLFGGRRFAILAALLLALTPAHLVVARQALDYLAPVPFVLGWLIALLVFIDRGSILSLGIGCALLGLALFSYIASWILMPLLFLLTLAVAWRTPARWRAITAGTIAFAIPLAALAAALAANPEMLANTLGRYQLGNGSRAAPGLLERVTLYWDYFNPSFLFFAGGSNPTQATGRAGVFLLGIAPLLIAGLVEAWRRHSPVWRVIAAAFIIAPLPVAITMPPAAAYSIARVMTLVPLGVLLATLGVKSLWRDRWPRRIAVALLAMIALQFTVFVADYAGPYQRRAGPRLDPANIAAVTDAVITHDRNNQVPAIYLSQQLDDGGARWRFFLLERARLDLWSRSHSMVMASRSAIEPGALIVCYRSEPEVTPLIGEGYAVVAEIADPGGAPATLVLKAPG